jgi:RND family efflux transporter MFP subunit
MSSRSRTAIADQPVAVDRDGAAGDGEPTPEVPWDAWPAGTLARRWWRRGPRLLVGVLAVVVVAGAAAAATLLVHRTSVPPVVVTAAAPAVINSTPGGIGVTASRVSFSLTADLFHVTAPVTVAQVDVVEGSVVKAGQPLVRLDPTQIADSAQAVQLQLAQVQGALLQAVKNYNLTGLPSYSQLVAEYQGDVAEYQEELQLLQGNSAVITSPINGEVYSVAVVPGNVASPTKTLVQVVDESQVKVSAGIQLTDMASVKVGQAAVLTFAGLPGVTINGVVAAVSPRATNSGLDATVVVYAPNLAQSPVPIGTKTFVHVMAQVRAPVTVPVLAVSDLTLDPAVYVVRAGHVHRVRVVLGAVDEDRAEVTSGLAPGQAVALTNTQTLTDGQAVTVEQVAR